MPGDSVWLGSTHPKPSPTRFRGWLALPGPELPLNMSSVHVENRGSHPCVLGSQNGRLPGAVGGAVPAGGPKTQKNWGAAWCFRAMGAWDATCRQCRSLQHRRDRS